MTPEEVAALAEGVARDTRNGVAWNYDHATNVAAEAVAYAFEEFARALRGPK